MEKGREGKLWGLPFKSHPGIAFLYIAGCIGWAGRNYLKAIKHVDVVRIGTRVPVTLPQRLYDPELIDLLGSTEKVYIQTHFNHPRELTDSARAACACPCASRASSARW